MQTNRQASSAPLALHSFGQTQWGPDQPESAGHFDSTLDTLVDICHRLILTRGVFHLGVHFASSQLVCWTFDNPYSYQVYTAEEVFSDGFMQLFAPLDSHLHTCIPRQQVKPILDKLVSLRHRQEGGELRNASIHMLNGYIALSFACDDTRYIGFKDFIPAAQADRE